MFKAGDEVIIFREPDEDEDWDDYWVNNMGDRVNDGKVYVVSPTPTDSPRKVILEGTSLNWPVSCLRYAEPRLFDL